MRDYVILTDSCSDLPADLVSELELDVLPLSFVMEGKEYFNYPDNRDIDPKDFYNKMRSGALGTTSAINVAVFAETMTALVGQEKDILCISFSSALSTTYQSACIAAEDVMAAHPGSKILVCDSRAASLGQGLLVYLAARQRGEGKSLQEVRDWVEKEKYHLCHWFTVDDLMYLKRGGRLNAATALVGTALGIKPVLHIDNEGHLINMGKARGRRASLTALVDKMAELAVEPQGQVAFISHGDCLEDAKAVEQMLKQRLGVKKVIISYVGPVIGAHTGPGVVALFFLGKER